MEDESSEKVATSKLIMQGHDNFELIFMMLMGIRTSVGKFANTPPRPLTPADFDQKWDGDFLAKGSNETPAHNHHDFKFKDYAPLVFRETRERFGIMAQDYMLSLTSEYVLVEMFTNSRSGSFFFYSADYRFILKTCEALSIQHPQCTDTQAVLLSSCIQMYQARGCILDGSVTTVPRPSDAGECNHTAWPHTRPPLPLTPTKHPRTRFPDFITSYPP